MITFIWNKNRPRLKTAILINRKEEGGVSLPDFQHYHFVAHHSWWPPYPLATDTLTSYISPPGPTPLLQFLVPPDPLYPLSHLVAGNISNRDWFQYWQLSSFYNHLKLKTQIHNKLLPFEKLCLWESYPTKVLSSVYTMLREGQIKQYPPPIRGDGRWIWVVP